MAQNRSTAVMQNRIDPYDALDDYPTPPWATRALCEWLQDFGYELGLRSVREPAANRGHMVAPLSEYFGAVEASDIHDYGAGFPVRDYLSDEALPMTYWTVTNPPFKAAQAFIQKARATSMQGCAVIVRSAFLESVGRYNSLFSETPPSDILQFTERVVMHKGKLSAKGSTATAYCWLVWRNNARNDAPRFGWIPPCRKRLERPEDYAAYEVQQ